MDYNNLYQILSQVNDENEAASPYTPFNSAMGQIGTAAIQLGAKEGDYKTGILGALLSGILGGAGQSLSNSWVEDKNAQATDLLDQAITGKTLQRPDGMTPSVFSKVQNAGSIWKDQQEQAQQQAEQELQSKIVGKALEKAIENPYQAERYLQTANKLLGGQTTEPLTRENIDPEAARYESLLQKYQGNAGLAEAEFNRGKEASQLEALGLDKIGNLPSNLQTQAIKELAVSNSNEASSQIANEAFNVATELGSLSSAIPFTDSNTKLSNARNTLMDVVQKQQGFEKSDKAMARLMATLPDANDTKNQIELKRQNYLSLLNAVSEKTPLADIAIAKKQSPLNQAFSANLPAGAKPTGRTVGGKPVLQLPDGSFVVE